MTRESCDTMRVLSQGRERQRVDLGLEWLGGMKMENNVHSAFKELEISSNPFYECPIQFYKQDQVHISILLVPEPHVFCMDH